MPEARAAGPPAYAPIDLTLVCAYRGADKPPKTLLQRPSTDSRQSRELAAAWRRLRVLIRKVHRELHLLERDHRRWPTQHLAPREQPVGKII